MKILVMGEFSGRVRDALIKGGHDATSCDFRPTERPGPHYQGDVRDIIEDDWGAMIAFPDCTYLCGSGLHWNNRGRGWEKTEEALEFVAYLLNRKIPYIGLENPVGCISTRIGLFGGEYRVAPRGTGTYQPVLPWGRIPVQKIQPYEFGEDASKGTCLFLKGFPPLVKTPLMRCRGRFVEYPRGSGKIVERWANQTDSNQNRLGPSPTRAKERAETYQGIADAIGDQWGRFLHEQADKS